MASRIALMQSRRNHRAIERERHNISERVGELAEIAFLSTVDEGLPWSSPEKIVEEYDGFIFGGSSDFDFHGGREENDPARVMSHDILYRLENLISYLRSHHVPVLGICFGHQLIGHAFGAECVNDKDQSKFGTHEVRLTEEGARDSIFNTLPETFMAQYAHKDSLTRLPDGAELLAESDVCRFGALRYGPSMYTFQFHPEVTRFEDPFPHEPSPEASKIIPLWIETMVKK